MVQLADGSLLAVLGPGVLLRGGGSHVECLLVVLADDLLPFADALE